jgi:Domain of unknown function (DUF4271)
LAGGMQSNQFKSDAVKSNLNLNPVFLETKSLKTNLEQNSVNLLDSAVLDSLNANYIAPDSLIIFGYKQEWSQFKTVYISDFDYQKELIQPLPYDSLYTVLKKVEVVYPGKKVLRSNPDWLVGVLLISFLLFASVRLIFNKYLSQLIQSTINYSTFTRTFRERYFNLFHASFRLDLVFSLILALFGYQSFNIFKISLGAARTYYTYLICLGIVFGYFLIKKTIYHIIGILTESKTEVQEYLFSITVYNRVLGLFLMPVTATIAFIPLANAEPMLYAGLAVIAIFYLMSLFRGAKIFLKKHFSISYLILYLCTLEFLPLVLIYVLLLM